MVYLHCCPWFEIKQTREIRSWKSRMEELRNNFKQFATFCIKSLAQSGIIRQCLLSTERKILLSALSFLAFVYGSISLIIIITSGPPKDNFLHMIEWAKRPSHAILSLFIHSEDILTFDSFLHNKNLRLRLMCMLNTNTQRFLILLYNVQSLLDPRTSPSLLCHVKY
jgi:hypothetical protein